MIDFDLLQETSQRATDSSEYGVQIVDQVESETFELYFGDLRSFRGASKAAFNAPIDTAVEIEVDRIEFPNLLDFFCRVDQELVDSAVGGEKTTLPPEQYEIEVSTAPIKLYIRTGITGVEVTASDGVTIMEFDGGATVKLGARSHHRTPAGTITTPQDPEHLAEAVSYFGSALKTTSPERSFPTLRGHPPLIEFGDEFNVPDEILKPETGITIEVPPHAGSIFQVAPLAYYLGATVEIGGEQTLHLPESDVVITGEGDNPSVNEVLTHIFLMDCAVRTAGLYSMPLKIHEQAVEKFGIDAEWLYTKPLDERVESYLRFEIGALNDCIRWPSTVDIEPTLSNGEFLPFLAHELAWVRSPPPEVSSDVPGAYPSSVTEFMRGDDRDADAPEYRPAPGRQDKGQVVSEVVSPVPTESVGHSWIGDQIPLKTTKPVLSSYKKRAQRTEKETDGISIMVVCNDERMQSETEDLYDHRKVLDMDVEVVTETTKAELESALQQNEDLLHFIGHVDDTGLQCTDGYLDTGSLTDVGIESFVLNGCRSYHQGMELVNAGCEAGVVTLADVDNGFATEAGRRIARLLDYGFDLYGALDIVQRYITTGGHYSIVGDGRFMLTHSTDGAVMVVELESDRIQPGEDVYPVTLHGYPNKRFGLGTMTRPYIGDSNMRYLSSGELDTIEVDRAELDRFLDLEQWPMVVDGDFQWSTEVTIDELL